MVGLCIDGHIYRRDESGSIRIEFGSKPDYFASVEGPKERRREGMKERKRGEEIEYEGPKEKKKSRKREREREVEREKERIKEIK